jgi:CAAX prenyl protease-like protein
MLPQQWQRWAYLCIRVAGPTLVVPVMEELFFRDWLMRILVGGVAFEEVPIGKFTWTSLIVMSLFFGINHGMPPSGPFVAGVVYGLLMGILVIRTKSLGSCIVAHAITNWTLYLYVIYAGDWQFM